MKRCTSQCVGRFPCAACRDVPDTPQPLAKGNDVARLIEPDGTHNIIMPIADAIRHCATRPGWRWELYSDAGVPG